jgi:hypothetical protein
MTFRKTSSEMNVMPHLPVVALSSRGSLPATGCFVDSVPGRRRFWASSGALGVFLIVLRSEVFSPLGPNAELSIVSTLVLG